MDYNKLGMFIHWGIFAMTEHHEQALARADMSFDVYDEFPKSFNPKKYNPEKWVKFAKKCGMKYICFTTKHHDGFCMWDTKETDYNIMNTPFKKDALKMLADACKKHGMKLSLYYSNPDWHHENAYNEKASHQWKSRYPERADSVKYREFIKRQITELLTNYGEIYTLFWDISPEMIDKSINQLCRKLQPNILINNRGYDDGDFDTPERDVPEGERFRKMTEACESVGEQAWGYRKNEDYMSIRYLKCSIDKVMAMGGSYLLNVGPKVDGTFPKQAINSLRAVGDWYNRMNGALEEHEKSDFEFEFLFKNPCIVTQKNGKKYFHFYNGLRSNAVNLIKYPSVPKKAVFLNSGKEVGIRYETLPMHTNEDFIAVDPVVSFIDIPCNDYPDEPMVLEVEF